MTYTYDNLTVSDLHKDAYGFRPSESFWMDWDRYNPAEKQARWDMMCQQLEWEMEWEAKRQAAAIVSFEERITGLIELGAGDRPTAIRWLMQACNIAGVYGSAYANEELEFEMGLPFGYLTRGN